MGAYCDGYCRRTCETHGSMGERRIIFPPPPQRHVDLGIVSEIPTELGVILWRAMGRVSLFIGAPPETRAALFNPRPSRDAVAFRGEARTTAPPALIDPLDRFDLLVRSPLALRTNVLAEACGQVAQVGGDERVSGNRRPLRRGSGVPGPRQSATREHCWTHPPEHLRFHTGGSLVRTGDRTRPTYVQRGRIHPWTDRVWDPLADARARSPRAATLWCCGSAGDEGRAGVACCRGST